MVACKGKEMMMEHIKKIGLKVIKPQIITSILMLLGLIGTFIYSMLFIKGWFYIEAFTPQIIFLSLINIILAWFVVYKYKQSSIIYFITIFVFILSLLLALNVSYVLVKIDLAISLYVIWYNAVAMINQFIYILFSLIQGLSGNQMMSSEAKNQSWGMHIVVIIYLFSAYFITSGMYIVQCLKIYSQIFRQWMFH